MTYSSPITTSAGVGKPSAWDAVYSINMGIACFIAYAITTWMLFSVTPRDVRGIASNRKT